MGLDRRAQCNWLLTPHIEPKVMITSLRSFNYMKGFLLAGKVSGWIPPPKSGLTHRNQTFLLSLDHFFPDPS